MRHIALPPPFIGLLILSSAIGVSTRASAGDPQEEQFIDHDPTVYPPSGTRSRLLLTGAVVTGVWYGAAVGTSYLWSDSDGARYLRIPIVGPTMALTKTGCGDRERGCGTFTVVLRTLFTTLSAVGQVGGLAAIGEALLFPSTPTAVRAAPGYPANRELHRADRHTDRAPDWSDVAAFPLVTEEGALGLVIASPF